LGFCKDNRGWRQVCCSPVANDLWNWSARRIPIVREKLKFIKRKLKIFYVALTYNIFGLFYLVIYLYRLGSGGDKFTRAKFFNEYVNRKVQNIRKELIRKRMQMKEKNKWKHLKLSINFFCAFFQFLYYYFLSFSLY
jgi:hypothetical protein